MAGNKHTQMSAGFQLARDRLMAGHPVPMTVLKEIREIGMAEKRLERPCTDPSDIRRSGIQMEARSMVMSLGTYTGKDAGGKPVYSGPVKNNKELHLLLGLPACGKSTIADSLSAATGSVIMDSDMVKEMIPEYDGGWGAAAVHDESSYIMDGAVSAGIAKGANMILPKTSTDASKLKRMLKDAKDEGYTCYVHAIDLSPSKAMGRMLGRFEHTGRYIPPSIAAGKIGPDGENLVREAFEQVAMDPEVCDGWTLWSNDVPMGQPSVLLGHSENPDPGIQALIQDADTDRSHLIGVEPESREEAEAAVMDIYDAIDKDMAEDMRRAVSLKKPARDQAVRYTAAQSGKARELDDAMRKTYGPGTPDGSGGGTGVTLPGE